MRTVRKPFIVQRIYKGKLNWWGWSLREADGF